MSPGTTGRIRALFHSHFMSSISERTDRERSGEGSRRETGVFAVEDLSLRRATGERRIVGDIDGCDVRRERRDSSPTSTGSALKKRSLKEGRPLTDRAFSKENYLRALRDALRPSPSLSLLPIIELWMDSGATYAMCFFRCKVLLQSAQSYQGRIRLEQTPVVVKWKKEKADHGEDVGGVGKGGGVVTGGRLRGEGR